MRTETLCASFKIVPLLQMSMFKIYNPNNKSLYSGTELLKVWLLKAINSQ